MIAVKHNIEAQHVRGLVPDWITEESLYANNQYGGKNPQLTALEGGLQPGQPAYQDLFEYLSRFFTYEGQAHGDELVILQASRALGKCVGTSRALVSAFNQSMHDLDVSSGDDLTMEEFEDRWWALDTLADFPSDHHTSMPRLIETQAAAIHGQLESPQVAQDLSLDLLVEQAQWFGAFTLNAACMATPGTSSGEMPTHWEAYNPPAVLN